MSNNNSQRPGAAMMEMARSAGMMGASSAKGLLSQVGVRAPVAADNDDSNGANHEPGLGDADEKARRKATREYIALQDKVRAAEKAIAEAPDDEADGRCSLSPVRCSGRGRAATLTAGRPGRKRKKPMASRYCLLNTFPNGGAPFGEVFTADTLGHAQALAQAVATLYQKSLRLAVLDGAPPYTTYDPAASGSALGNAPTGIGF